MEKCLCHVPRVRSTVCWPRVGACTRANERRIPEAIASLLSAGKDRADRQRARTGEKLSGSSNLYSAALLSGKRRSGYKQCDAPPILSWNHGTHTDPPGERGPAEGGREGATRRRERGGERSKERSHGRVCARSVEGSRG